MKPIYLPGDFDIEVEDTPLCNICGFEPAKYAVRTEGIPIPENICQECFNDPDYQLIIKKEKCKISKL